MNLDKSFKIKIVNILMWVSIDILFSVNAFAQCQTEKVISPEGHYTACTVTLNHLSVEYSMERNELTERGCETYCEGYERPISRVIEDSNKAEALLEGTKLHVWHSHVLASRSIRGDAATPRTDLATQFILGNLSKCVEGNQSPESRARLFEALSYHVEKLYMREKDQRVKQKYLELAEDFLYTAKAEGDEKAEDSFASFLFDIKKDYSAGASALLKVIDSYDSQESNRGRGRFALRYLLTAEKFLRVSEEEEDRGILKFAKEAFWKAATSDPSRVSILAVKELLKIEPRDEVLNRLEAEVTQQAYSEFLSRLL